MISVRLDSFGIFRISALFHNCTGIPRSYLRTLPEVFRKGGGAGRSLYSPAARLWCQAPLQNSAYFRAAMAAPMIAEGVQALQQTGMPSTPTTAAWQDQAWTVGCTLLVMFALKGFLSLWSSTTSVRSTAKAEEKPPTGASAAPADKTDSTRPRLSTPPRRVTRRRQLKTAVRRRLLRAKPKRIPRPRVLRHPRRAVRPWDHNLYLNKRAVGARRAPRCPNRRHPRPSLPSSSSKSSRWSKER